ncbi:MAG: DUF4476 domain-containing protein [Mediterranea sp.]|jgi:hypothetical protein|nr:DUF4476 domain-containing protein [Mediterranea sp.]
MDKIDNTLKSMRKKLRVACALVLVAALSGCGTYRASQIMDIHPGMTQKEVSELMGKPTFRRFNNGVEEWEYEQVGNYFQWPRRVFVTFENGKVIGMDSNGGRPQSPTVVVAPPAPPVARQPTIMDDKEFADFTRDFFRLASRDERMRLVDEMLSGHDLTMEQCAEIVKDTSSTDQLKMAKKLYPYVRGKRNPQPIIDAIFFPSEQEEMRRFVREFR